MGDFVISVRNSKKRKKQQEKEFGTGPEATYFLDVPDGELPKPEHKVPKKVDWGQQGYERGRGCPGAAQHHPGVIPTASSS